MSPSELSWLQGCLFFFLSVAAGYGLNQCRNRRTNRGTSDVELGSVLVDNGTTPTPFDDAESWGGDEEARSPSNLSNPVGEAMASTGALSCPDRNRLRCESLRRPRSLLQPSAETGETSQEAPKFARRETTCTIVGERTPSPISSTTAGLLRPSRGENRKRPRSDSRRRKKATVERTKSPFEKFMAKDEARNVGWPEPANMIVADSSSTSMASTTAVLRRHFVPRPPREIPLVDHLQASTSDGLHRRPRISQGPSGEVMRYNGIRYIRDRRTWVAEMTPPNSANKCCFGEFKSQLRAAFAIDAAFFYYEKPHLMNFLRSTPAMMAILPPLPAGLNNKYKLLFAKDKVKRLARYAADHPEVVNPSVRSSESFSESFMAFFSRETLPDLSESGFVPRSIGLRSTMPTSSNKRK